MKRRGCDGSRREGRWQRGGRFSIAGVAALLLGASACASPPIRPAPDASVPISIEPRCVAPPVDVQSEDPTHSRREGLSRDASEFAEAHLPGGLRWYAESGRGALRSRIDLGFPVLPMADTRADASADAAAEERHREQRVLALAARLMAAGAFRPDPESFRRRALQSGVSLQGEAQEGWIWLELRFPPSRSSQAIELLNDWLTLEISDFEATERAIEAAARIESLLSLAEQSAPANQASRLFGRLHPSPSTDWPFPPESGLADLEGSPVELLGSPDPARWILFLRSLFRTQGAVAAYRAASDAPGAEAESFRSALAGRLESGRLLSLRRGAHARAIPTARASASPLRPRAQTAKRRPVPSGPSGVVAPPEERASPIAIIDRPSALQAELLVGYPTLGALHPDYEALQMLASLLGDSVGGRLFHDLRERQGLAYIIGAKVSPEGRLAAVTQARHERVVALVRGIEAHFEALVRQPLLTCEKDRLVERFRGQLLLESSRPEERASRLRSDWALRGAPLSEAERRRRIDASATQLDRVAQRYLSGAPRIVIVGDADWLERDLSQAFPERRIEIHDGAATEEPRRTRSPRAAQAIEKAPH